jgi:preprotein translocase subunit SecG
MIFSILIIVASTLLILVVLIQNSKGGGIQSQFGAATQIMGVKRGTEFIEKATWGLAITVIVLSVLMAPKSSITQNTDGGSESIAKKKAATAITTQQAPVQQVPGSQQVPGGQQVPK